MVFKFSIHIQLLLSAKMKLGEYFAFNCKDYPEIYHILN
jgi:hypothetical protein